MLEIKTLYGNFNNFKHLYLFMKEENLKEIEVDTNYIFSRVCKTNLTLEEVKQIVDSSK